MVLRIFDCDLCMIGTLDLLAHPHISIPYVQMGLITALYTNNNRIIMEMKIVVVGREVGGPSHVSIASPAIPILRETSRTY